jgi:hypothetical protein
LILIPRAKGDRDRPAQWKYSTRSGLFVPESHLSSGANGSCADNAAKTHRSIAPVRTTGVDSNNLPWRSRRGDVLDQDPDARRARQPTSTNGRVASDPTEMNSHPDSITKLHFGLRRQEPFRLHVFIVGWGKRFRSTPSTKRASRPNS